MPRLKPYKIIGYLLFIVCFGVLLFPLHAQSFSHLKFSADRVTWTGLSFHAKNLWVEITTDIQLVFMPSKDIEALLISTSKGTPVKPAALEAAQMTINTTIDPKFRSLVSLHNRIWFNPADATALGRIRLRRGEDDFKKIYRFTKQGVFRHRIEPKNKKEAALVPEKWTDIKDSFYPYDKARMGCSGVTERSLLIYIISAAAVVNNNDPLSLCVFGKRQLHRVNFRYSGTSPMAANYIEKGKHGEIQRQGIVKSLRIDLLPEPMESDLKQAENFSFLGFHKDISVYIDPTTRLPIKASGIIPTVGRADLKLQEVVLK
jgi:hypothetical protein